MLARVGLRRSAPAQLTSEGDGAGGYLVERYWPGVTEQAVPTPPTEPQRVRTTDVSERHRRPLCKYRQLTSASELQA